MRRHQGEDRGGQQAASRVAGHQLRYAEGEQHRDQVEEDFGEMPRRGMKSEQRGVGGEPFVLHRAIVRALRQVEGIAKPPDVVAQRVECERPGAKQFVVY